MTRSLKFSSTDSIREALGFSLKHVNLLTKSAAVWLAIFIVFTLIFQVMGVGLYRELSDAVAYVTANPSAARAEGYESLAVLTAQLETITLALGVKLPIYTFVDRLLRIVIFASVGVAYLRFFLKSEEPPTIRFSKLEIRFAACIIFCIAFAGLCAASVYYFFDLGTLSNARVGIFAIVGTCALLLVSARFLIVFPRLSEENLNIGPRRLWTISRGHTWSLFGGSLLALLASLPISLVKAFVSSLGTPMVVELPVRLFLSLLVWGFLLTFLAICHRHFTAQKT